MAQILDPIPSDRSGQIVCCYVNATSKMQIARVTNVTNWYFERVVFPGQRLVFEAFPEALLEIHTGMMASAILSDKIPCDRLRIRDENQPSVHPTYQPYEERSNLKQGLEVAATTRGSSRSLMAVALTSVD